jgi:hypothetical protein
MCRQTLSILLFLLINIAFAGCRQETKQANMNPEAQRARGAEIVAEYQKRESTPTRHVQLRMTIISANEPEKEYEFEIWRKRDQNETKSLLHVIKPSTERGLVSLSTQSKGQEPVNVSYRPDKNEFLESKSDDQAFGGLTVQEILGDWSKYESRLVSEKDVDGVKMYEIENTLKPGEASTIKRFIVLIRADNMLPAEAHVFNGQDTEIRTYRIKEFRTIEGHPTFWRIEIENPVRKNTIKLEVLNESFNQRLDDQIFARDNMKKLAAT